MSERKELILNTIIEEHIKTGAPVGSSVLVKKYNLDVSSATVRNEMAILEDEGFIVQPHTSAGRVPTEKAYKFFVSKIKNDKIKNQGLDPEIDCVKAKDEVGFKKTAKELSQITGSAVFWAFHRHNIYYTGISNLFQQPEFSQIELVYDISSIIDKIDEIINNIFDQYDIGVHTLIGSENPFGNFISTVLAKYKSGDNVGMFGIVGPVRMDYQKNIILVHNINTYLNKK